jgi:hypothetical protein
MPILSPAVLVLLSVPLFEGDSLEERRLPPHAAVTFPAARPSAWVTMFELTTASGACYQVQVDYRDGMDFEVMTAASLLAANWVVESSAFFPLRVYGTRTKSGETDAIRSLRITSRIVEGEGATPLLRSVHGATVEMRSRTTDERRAGPIRRTGPDITDTSFVEFDLAPLPASGPLELPWRTSWGVYSWAGDSSYDVGVSTDIDPTEPWRVLEDVLESFSRMGCKAEIVGKTELRVYGMVIGGRYYPALKGIVESEDLKPEELPKVTNARS